MRRTILWLFLSCLMVLTLVAWSCDGTTLMGGEQEEEEEEEEVTPIVLDFTSETTIDEQLRQSLDSIKLRICDFLQQPRDLDTPAIRTIPGMLEDGADMITALASPEAIQTKLSEAENIMGMIYIVFRYAKVDAAEDKEYYLSLLEEAEQIQTAFSDMLEELRTAAAALAAKEEQEETELEFEYPYQTCICTRLFATNPQTGDIYEYDGRPNSWIKVGGPGDMFVVDSEGQLYGLSVGGNSVWRYDNEPMDWTYIGGAADKIYAGGDKLFTTNPQTGEIYEYDGQPNSWTKVGGPGDMFVVDSEGQLYGLSVGGNSVWRYDNELMDWTQIGWGMIKIYAGGHTLLAKFSQTGEIHQYNSETNFWTTISYPMDIIGAGCNSLMISVEEEIRFARDKIVTLLTASRILSILSDAPLPHSLAPNQETEARQFISWLHSTSEELETLASRWEQEVVDSYCAIAGGLMNWTTAMQEMNQSFSLQFLALQQNIQAETREFNLLSSLMKCRHDTAKNAINNIR